MATTVKQGSRGSDVKELQAALNRNGSNLAVDGIFGSKTESALKAYQAAHSLAADGIAGPKTWASLNGSGSSAQKKAAAPAASVTAVTALGNEYDPSATTAAKADLANHEANAPAPYKSAYADRTAELSRELADRGQTAYSLADDPLYAEYKREYLANADRAMRDARGMAAANTGGYGSSYAETAAQQAYQSYLSGLNSVIPTLYDRAREAESSRYDDALRELQALTSLDEADYKRWAEDYDRYMDWLKYEYDKTADEQAQKNWEKTYAKKK